METTFNWKTKLTRWAGCAALVSVIAACGGGGGGDGGNNTPIIDPVNNANAVDDAFPAIQSAAGGTTAAVQQNDTVTINNTTTAAVLGTNASITAVTRTSAAPTAGSISFNTATGVITVAAGTSAGAYAFSYQLCRTAPNQTVCDVATASGSVTSSPPASDVLTRADLANCPAATSPIVAPSWNSCVAGKRVPGKVTFATTQSCELRFLANGGIEYIHNGVTYVPSVNGAARSGVYGHLPKELFLGSLSWDLGNTLSVNRLSDVDLTLALNSLAGTSTIEVEYFEAVTNARRVLNCTPNAI